MSDWQPIETAPKDGTPMLVYLAEVMVNSYVQVATFHPNISIVGGQFAFDAPQATHWMPLPEPPKEV